MFSWFNHTESNKLQEELENMKVTNKLLMEDNQVINDRLQ